ncbi:MAG: putative peptide maturation dehydrogenase [Gemmatimonadetes bacterium]|nr:putative peptide maturation dehydrogenase [Gemmatimonadota bacterium]
MNLTAMLQGSIAVSHEERLVAITLLTGERYVLSELELQLLSALPSSHWLQIDQVPHPSARETAAPLIDAGLVLADPAEGAHAALRAREERFGAIDWDEYAAHYHVMSRVKDQDVGEQVVHAVEAPSGAPADSRERLQEYVELASSMSRSLAANAWYGPPPPHFHRVDNPREALELPIPRVRGELFDLLTSRKTIRVYDQANPVTAEELSTLLYYTYGAQSTVELIPGLVGIRKTSPSGGSLHPIEAYPLVLNVRGVETGLYHYSVERHALELLRPMTRPEAEQMVETMALGQSYFRSAHAVFILTARWYRNFWKYRRAPKSYRVIHVDAGHLSQTLYLLCQRMGLGAFYTGAVNDINIEDVLQLDPLQEGVIGISGCGRPLNGGAPLTLITTPYVPPR